jgi:hypothetical protein
MIPGPAPSATAGAASDPSVGGTGPRQPDPRGGGRTPADATLLDAVADLRRDVAAVRLPFPVPSAAEAERTRRRLLDQLDDHLLPRLRELSAPAVVVVAGSTGAGKSTLVNTLLGEEVSPAGVLRPTTREPVLVHHPADAELLDGHPLLASLRVVAHEAVPRGLALVDAPDLDSLLEANRASAHRLLEAADLWLFLTTAARYGDALPWDVLVRAAERGTSLAMVLNRVPDDALATVRADLMGRLRDRGLAAVPLFLVRDLGPHQGPLGEDAVAPIRRWLTMVAGADRARSVILRTQRGALKALQPWVTRLAEAVEAQVEVRVSLERAVADAVAEPAERAARSVAAGGVAAGPVRARWAALVGRGGVLTGRLTARRGRDARARALAEVADELRSSVAVALGNARRHGEQAVAEALRAARAPGAAVVAALVGDAAEDRPEPGPPRTPSPEDAARAWLRAATDAVARLGEGDKQQARAVARLVRGVGAEGAGTLAALAAAGLGGAAALLARAVGRSAVEAVASRLADELGEAAAAQARAGAEPALAFLAGSVRDDAASALHLRLAVLKGLR